MKYIIFIVFSFSCVAQNVPRNTRCFQPNQLSLQQRKMHYSLFQQQQQQRQRLFMQQRYQQTQRQMLTQRQRMFNPVRNYKSYNCPPIFGRNFGRN